MNKRAQVIKYLNLACSLFALAVLVVLALQFLIKKTSVVYQAYDPATHYKFCAFVQRDSDVPSYDVLASICTGDGREISRVRIFKSLDERSDAWGNEFRVTKLTLNEGKSELFVSFADGHSKMLHVELGTF